MPQDNRFAMMLGSRLSWRKRPRAAQLAAILLLGGLVSLTLLRYGDITSSDVVIQESASLLFTDTNVVDSHAATTSTGDAKRLDVGALDIPGNEITFEAVDALTVVDEQEEVQSMTAVSYATAAEQLSAPLPAQETVSQAEEVDHTRRPLMVLQHFAPTSAGTPTALQDASRKSHERYCQAWGYAYKADEGDYTRLGGGHRGVNKVYSVLAAVLEELAKPDGDRAEWILQVDADVLIYDPSVPLHALLPTPEADLPDRPLMLANQDNMGFNAGVVFYAVNRDMADYLIEALAFESAERAQGRAPSDQHVLARTMEWGGVHAGDFLERPVEPPPPPPPQEPPVEVRNATDIARDQSNDDFETEGEVEATVELGHDVEVVPRPRRSRWSDRFYTIPMRWVNFYYARNFSDEGLQPDGGWTPQLHVHLVFHLKYDVDWAVYVREAEEVYEMAARIAAGYESESWRLAQHRPAGIESEVEVTDEGARSHGQDEEGKGAAEVLLDADEQEVEQHPNPLIDPVSRYMTDPLLERGEGVGLTLFDGGKTAEAAHRWWSGAGRQGGIDGMLFSDI